LADLYKMEKHNRKRHLLFIWQMPATISLDNGRMSHRLSAPVSLRKTLVVRLDTTLICARVCVHACWCVCAFLPMASSVIWLTKRANLDGGVRSAWPMRYLLTAVFQSEQLGSNNLAKSTVRWHDLRRRSRDKNLFRATSFWTCGPVKCVTGNHSDLYYLYYLLIIIKQIWRGLWP